MSKTSYRASVNVSPFRACMLQHSPLILMLIRLSFSGEALERPSCRVYFPPLLLRILAEQFLEPDTIQDAIE